MRLLLTMRFLLLTPCLLALLLAAGCGGSSAGGGETQAFVGNAGGDGSNTIAVTVPREAAYTIYLRDFTRPDHVFAAERTKEQTAAALADMGMSGRDLYVVSGERRSVLYYGYYKTFDPELDRREAAKAQGDREAFERMVMTNTAGDKIKAFPRAVFQALERPDPAAPAEWDLKNANGFWTVAIATYTDVALRKRAAVESVAEARRRGVEAYYHHDEVYSYVCIGTWPRGAIKEGQSSSTLARDHIDPNNPRPLLLLGANVSPELRRTLEAKAGATTGQQPLVLESRVEIQDPSLMKVMNTYDYDVDGYKDNEEPLLLQIADVTGRKPDAIDSDTLDTGPDAEDLDALLTPIF